MSKQYKENNFSTESSPILLSKDFNNINRTPKPNIDHLIKRILTERRKNNNKNIAIFGGIILSSILTYIYF